MIINILREIGLTDYESRVYVALLDLGKATSGEILQQASLNTGKIYDILASLKNKGFVSEIIEAGVKKFFPADPQRIYDYLEEKKQDISQQEASLGNIIPDIMKKIEFQKEAQRVEVFYGYKGVCAARIKEINRYNKKNVIRIFGVGKREKYTPQIYNYFTNYLYPIRIEKKMKIKKLLDHTARKYREDHEEIAEVRFFPYASPVTIATIGDLTIIDILIEEPVTITIESQAVADSFVQQFELFWKLAKE